MKTTFTYKYFLILTFFLSFNLFSNDSFQNENLDKQLGIGLSTNYSFIIENSGGLIATQNHILLSSNNENLKLDLGLMIFNSHNSYLSSFSSTTILDVFIGVYNIDKINKNLNLYYGGKLGIIASKSSSNSDSDTSIDYFYLTPIIGSEYFFIPNFSISAEIGLNIHVRDDEDNDFDRTEFYISTLSSLVVRMYF